MIEQLQDLINQYNTSFANNPAYRVFVGEVRQNDNQLILYNLDGTYIGDIFWYENGTFDITDTNGPVSTGLSASTIYDAYIGLYTIAAANI